MALTRVDTGLQSFPDFNRNQQLANAQIYIGVPGLDPAVLANQYQAFVVQEDGTQVAVAQPIRTSAGGVPTYFGSPVQIALAETAYSVKVLSSLGSQIYYQPDNTDLALIDAAQVSYTPAGTGAVATTVEEVFGRTVTPQDFMSAAEKMNVFLRLGTADVTLAVRKALDQNVEVHFPSGVYAVSSVNFDVLSGKYTGRPTFLGITSSPESAVVEITNRNMTFESLTIDQNFNTNYTSALKWHSPSAGQPAQFNKIKELSLNNCIIGILFGQLNGTPVVDAPQSENSITHMSTRGCQIPIYINQSNGFLLIGESSLNSLRNEWEIANPGVYSYADSRIIKTYQGVLQISDSELLKTDTQLGYGFENQGGDLFFSNCTMECASTNYLLAGGQTVASNASHFFSNASDEFCEIDPASEGLFLINNFKVLRSAGAINSTRGLIEHNDNYDFKVVGNNIEIENFIPDTCINVSGGSALRIAKNFKLSNFSCKDGDPLRPDLFIGANNTGDSLLAAKGVDLNCDTLLGWYYELVFGGGSTFGVVANGPSLSPKDKTLANSIENNATGLAYVRTLDTTSLATIQNTGLFVTPNQSVLITAWVRRVAATGNSKFNIVQSDLAGAVTRSILAGTSELDDNWRYIQTIYRVPAGVKYIGIEIEGETGAIRISGADVKLLN